MQEKTEISDVNQNETPQTTETDPQTPILNRHQRRANARFGILATREKVRKETITRKRETKKAHNQFSETTNI